MYVLGQLEKDRKLFPMLGEQFVRDMADIIPEVVGRTKKNRLGAVDFSRVNGCVQAPISGPLEAA